MAARLNKQKQCLQAAGYVLIEVVQNSVWNIILPGPEETPFAGGQYVVKFKFEGFPFKAPVVSLDTKIYHPNIDKDGGICADMLEIGEKWAPVKSITSIMDKIKAMMVAPNVESPMNPEAAADYKSNTWFAKAKAMNQQYAK